VLKGVLYIEFRDRKVTLELGEMYVVQKGLKHRPIAVKECKIMLVEPRGVVNTGDVQSDLTAEQNV
jgi:mannose-6-phosphate isomerase-like protein (cupin superfamily)